MKNNRLIFTLICIVFFVSFVISLSSGSVSLTQPNHNASIIFWELRLPRTLTALACGGLLALAGVMMQLLLQNPLADPYILGISSGAGFTTLCLILLGFNEWAYRSGAWLGSLLSISLVLFLTHTHRFQTHALLLTGIAIASGFSAGISFLLLLSNNATIHSMLFWLSGDLNNADYPWFALSILIVGSCILMTCYQGLNLLMRGEREAKALGLSVSYFKFLLFILSALFTASAVTLAGCLGFIGLIIPHLARQIVGFNHRLLIPSALLLGASLLMVSDTLARTLLSPQQLPVGIFMTCLGVPVFIWMLKRCHV